MQVHMKAQIAFFYNTIVIEAIKTIKRWSFDTVCKKLHSTGWSSQKSYKQIIFNTQLSSK